MKTNILIAAILALLGFAISGFQGLDNNDHYLSAAQNSPQLRADCGATALVSCAQCHSCQKSNGADENSLAAIRKIVRESYRDTAIARTDTTVYKKVAGKLYRQPVENQQQLNLKSK
jgi:mono/diheme cytochrome c family protein